MLSRKTVKRIAALVIMMVSLLTNPKPASAEPVCITACCRCVIQDVCSMSNPCPNYCGQDSFLVQCSFNGDCTGAEPYYLECFVIS